jgi:hypothetical protein
LTGKYRKWYVGHIFSAADTVPNGKRYQNSKTKREWKGDKFYEIHQRVSDML